MYPVSSLLACARKVGILITGRLHPGEFARKVLQYRSAQDAGGENCQKTYYSSGCGP